MAWIIVGIVALIAAAPFVREWFRAPVSAARDGIEDGGFAELSGGKTYYRWYGAPTSHVIVLIHGLTTPHWVFSGIVRGLNLLGYQVLAYDLFGRGLSDRPGDAQTPQFFLHQLNELLIEQGLDGPVSLLGYSMGGVIAAQFAVTYPERTDRVILLAPAGIDYTPAEPLKTAGASGVLGNWLWRVVGSRSLRRAARRDAQAPTVIPDLEKRMSEETGRRGYLRAVLSAHRESLAINLENLHRDLAKTEIPVLAIWGGEDKVIPLTSMGKLTQWNRTARHHVVDGVGHALPHAAPNEIIAAITTFFREV
ncbi:alpha/beta hydrolase [Maritimibacter sp. UBA3975]|uniref:alpha/beta fold hydrolase n=1 Tax=Maritimibacter sp. UBA3975 TaxID=1946833 RepID=UPI000C0A89AB|nr:alpha/beta hydrolase [Maritimibacter sp. UBA3975]MAM63694.1 alpha/beta hydrolase [Maritimibacter sp.]|tara:strand:- start:7358 stop:8281 length:924 start_codon:yes stop_codon:yes gene_type:complete